MKGVGRMKKRIILAGVIVLTLAVMAVFAQGFKSIKEVLLGFEEVPAVSTVAQGEFKATINKDETEITYELSYSALEGDVQQAHIHFGQRGVNGGISVWLCSNLPTPPTPASPPFPPTQACLPSPATITGTITPNHVVGPAGQGIAAGEFAELIRAIRAGSTYVNVHTTKFPGGEIRSQIDHGDGNEHGTRK
jgi:CHRD domain